MRVNGACRPLFVATVFVGSFLLFLIQPMVARMALPQLGGAPNVWNSAMLVYQALLLAGYGYAHWLSAKSLRRQVLIHIAALSLAALSLPIALARIAAPSPGWEAVWVPWLLLLTVGPVFLLVSAQAPLMQRWFVVDAKAGEPWALYAASNLGSFSGLIAYPLFAEPLLPLHSQSQGWALGYGALVALVVLCAWARRGAADAARPRAPTPAAQEALPLRRKLHWLALSAVPSGLMLSTTTHLTTDIFASPLLWVIPLGLYLLSFVIAFSDWRGPARVITTIAPVIIAAFGCFAMRSSGTGTLLLAGGGCLLLFAVAVSLHSRLYDLRPGTTRLTTFYLVMAAGGALGGLFTALLAPLVFDWVWEHPLLILAAAALMPLGELLRWRRMEGLEPGMARIALALLLTAALLLAFRLDEVALHPDEGLQIVLLTVFMTAVAILVMAWRWAFVLVLAMAMVGQGGSWTIRASLKGERTRSYFGVYTVRDYPQTRLRILTHGTTLHGQQSLDPADRDRPMTYYGPTSGIGQALAATPRLQGPRARIGVVGLGTGSLACLAVPGQDWTFFEIDPVILRYSTSGRFTYLRDCTPGARVVLGDARLELERVPAGSFDVLAIDAFSSDAIPLHLLTAEAFEVYLRALAPRGLLMVHISNRYIDLGPVISAVAKREGLAARALMDFPADDERYTPSRWIALSRDPSQIGELARMHPDSPWSTLEPPAEKPWTDDHASILPYIRWSRLTGNR
jgi:hypothetical protein